jgi:Uma2 family endonuclease
VSVAATTLLTAEDLLLRPRDGWRYELVEGVLHRMPPPGFEHGALAAQVGGLLFAHVRQHRLGRVLAAETGFQLASDPDTVRAPDVAFVTNDRLEQVDFDRHKYFPGAPDFLVEILSPSDSYSDVERKVGEWLTAGAKLVVLIDPVKQLVFTHRPGAPVQILSRGDLLDASDAVAGWRVQVAEVFGSEGELAS